MFICYGSDFLPRIFKTCQTPLKTYRVIQKKKKKKRKIKNRTLNDVDSIRKII